MMFNDSYYNAMDRGYYIPLQQSEQPVAMGGDFMSPDIGLSPKDIGVSAAPFGDQLQAFKARIFQGASKVELGFMGKGKGSMQGGNTTPEMFGKDERMDIRELAKANQVELSTHATPNAGSMAGFAQNNFDEHVREQTLHEIQRAIDFAADTTNGGAIVVHAQEFPRPIYDKYFAKEGFEAYPEEKERAALWLVDERNGRMQEVRKNMPVYEAVYIDHPDDPENYWQDIDGNKIAKTTDNPRELFKRVPKWNHENTDFETVRRDWDYFVKYSEMWNRDHPDKPKTPEEMWFQIQSENQVLRSKGSSLFYARSYEDQKKRYDELRDVLKFVEQLEKDTPPEEMWKIMEKEHPRGASAIDRFRPTHEKTPVQAVKEAMRDAEMDLRFMHEASASADAQAAEGQNNIEHMKPVRQYAEKKTADTLARAAMYTIDREKKITKEGIHGWEVRQGEPFEKPLFLAVENFFPDVHGGHPDEVRDMVINARRELASRLKSHRGMSESAALKTAQERIKATWDTSHANMWRKYFKANYEGEPHEKIDARFKQWYLDKAKQWKDEGIIGHIHVDDNFGWEDEHVTPGQGNAPIKEFIQLMKDKVDKGEINVIVEPAHQDYRAVLGGWKLFGSSIYGAQGGGRDSMLDIGESYFGRNAPPYFIYGESAPDPEAYQLWSQTRLE